MTRYATTMKSIVLLYCFLFIILPISAQSWQDVGGGTNNSSHGMLVWNGKLINLGSFNNPCNRVAAWNGTAWECLGGGVGIVARAGVVWNGNLVVAGDFWNVQQPCSNCNGIAMWDGVQWTNIGAGFNNDVLCLTVWNGDLVAAGDFTQSNGIPCSRIARWTGTTWEQIGPSNAFNNDIRTITEFEGELWIGGDFSNVGGCTSCDGVVKWDGSAWVGGNSGVDLSGGVDTTVRVLYVSPSDGRLYMGGHFRGLTPNGVYNADLNGVAVYDGSDWFALGSGVGDDPADYVRAISEYNGQIVVGGSFTTASGTAANKIARFNLTTQSWSALGQGFDGVGIDEYVKSAAVWNGILFAGGAYTQAEGAPMDYIAQWYEPPVAAPIAAMNQEQNSVCAGSCVSFSDLSTYNPTSWNWQFPGGSVTSSTLQNPPLICYSTPGTYTATLTACNSVGCNTTSHQVTVVGAATVDVNSPTVCIGSSALLTANPSISGGTFLWSPGGQTTSSITINPTVNTTYSVSYTSSGCGSASATSNVTVISTPTVAVGNATVCEGEQATLNASPSVGGGDFTWSPGGETTQSITVSPLVTTTYSVVYEVGQCTSAPVNATVTVLPLPTVSLDNESVCAGSSITLTATPSVGGGDFMWSPGGELTQSITVSPTLSSSYSVVYDDGQCQSVPVTALVTVLPLPTVVVENQAICVGSSATITATPSISGGTYLWSPGGEITQSIVVSPVTTSSYSVVYDDGQCQSTLVTALVTVTSQPTVTVNDPTICAGSNANLTANPSVGGGTYLWSPGGETTQSINVNPITTSDYTVQYSVGQCSSDPVTATVTVEPMPALTAEDQTICLGSNALLTAVPSIGGGNYEWFPGGETTQSITVSPGLTTDYDVQYTLNNCLVTTEVTVNVLPLPSTTITVNSNELQANQSNAVYQWLDCSNSMNPINGATAQNFAPLSSGNYAVVVELNSCTDTSECITFDFWGLENPETKSIRFFPNPVDNELSVIVNDEIVGERLEIIDQTGRIVLSTTVLSTDFVISLEQLAGGIYQISVPQKRLFSDPLIVK